MNRIIVILAIVIVLIYPSYALSQVAISSFTTDEADAMRKAIIKLEQEEAKQVKQESDIRLANAILLIDGTVKPQLFTPSGNYLAQHTYILFNIRFIENEVKIAQDSEMRNELKKLLELELTDFKQLKLNHAEGKIT